MDNSPINYVGSDSSTYPFSAVAFVTALFPSGQAYSGSGAVVGVNDVLTASHVIYIPEEGGLAETITVYPGKDGQQEPFGSFTADQVDYFEIESQDNMLSPKESEYDFALIGFDEPVGNSTGWFGLDPQGGSGDYYLTGYPSSYKDETGPKMTNQLGFASKSPTDWIFQYESIESYPGHSGGPLWQYSDTGPALVGVASTEGWATDISVQYEEITTWIQENDSLLEQDELYLWPDKLIKKYFYDALAKHWSVENSEYKDYGPDWTQNDIQEMSGDYQQTEIMEYLKNSYQEYKDYLDQENFIIDYVHVLEEVGLYDKSAEELLVLVNEQDYTFDDIARHYHEQLQDEENSPDLMAAINDVVNSYFPAPPITEVDFSTTDNQQKLIGVEPAESICELDIILL